MRFLDFEPGERPDAAEPDPIRDRRERHVNVDPDGARWRVTVRHDRWFATAAGSQGHSCDNDFRYFASETEARTYARRQKVFGDGVLGEQMHLLNAFSLNMVDGDCTVDVVRIDRYAARKSLEEGYVSAVGHRETAAIFGQLLELPVEHARTTVLLRPGDRAVVGQYIGPRLPEGATTLPDDARIEWRLIRISGLVG